MKNMNNNNKTVTGLLNVTLFFPYFSHPYFIKSNNKAIRDGKYLARHMPVLGNVHPIKIKNIFFRDIISYF